MMVVGMTSLMSLAIHCRKRRGLERLLAGIELQVMGGV